MGLGTCCLVTCCCWAWCICCKGTMCCRSRPTSDGIEERTNSKELDVEAQQYLSGVPVQVMSEQHYTQQMPPQYYHSWPQHFRWRYSSCTAHYGNSSQRHQQRSPMS